MTEKEDFVAIFDCFVFLVFKDLTGTSDTPISRRKSFKKSLRESFRRLRRRRSERRKAAEEKAKEEKKGYAFNMSRFEQDPV